MLNWLSLSISTLSIVHVNSSTYLLGIYVCFINILMKCIITQVLLATQLSWIDIIQKIQLMHLYVVLAILCLL